MLKTILIANALSCALFGVLFLASGAAVAAFLGNPPILVLQVLGAGLLINTAHLVFTAYQKTPTRRAVLYFALGDVLWVVATIVMLGLGLFITTSAGIRTAIAVAAFVGACGLGQLRLAPAA